MRKAILSASCLAITCAAAFGQPFFEVASVKPAAPQDSNITRPHGGPGTSAPERFTYTNVTLKTLLLRAYGVKNYQVSGPAWLDSARFDIQANLSPGATRDQLNEMLANLLVERFHLTLHHETKELGVYELAVARNGPKLKASNLNLPPPAHEPGTPLLTVGTPGKDGFPQIPPGLSLMLGRMMDGRMRWTARLTSVADLASFLENELGRPVVDRTGLPGKYDFTLEFSRDGLRPLRPASTPSPSPVDTPSDGGLSLTGAVREQLGLKLESKKDPIDIVVVDHIDKAPTEN